MVARITLSAFPTDIEHGVWCETCLLPSRVRAKVIVYNPDTLARIGTGAYDRCKSCDP